MAGAADALGHHLSTIKCCECGIDIMPNAASMCASCLSASVDITADLPKQQSIRQCRKCFAWFNAQTQRWCNFELESADLLALCLRQIPQLKKDLKLIDASWIWTEPHSKRLKIRVTARKEVSELHGVVLQQSFIVEYVVKWQQCSACNKSFTNREWQAVVQVRQKGVSHKRTFLHLEQMILRSGAHAECSAIEAQRDGVDFFFLERPHAARFVAFVSSCVACRSARSEKLVSYNPKMKHANMKFSWSVELPRLSKDDLVKLPRTLAQQLGLSSGLVIVERVAASVHLCEPTTARRAVMSADKYWRHHAEQASKGIQLLANKAQAIDFIVLDIYGNEGHEAHQQQQLGAAASVALLSQAEVVRESDFGENDTTFHVTTHLGRVLEAGDTVLAYDIGAIAATVEGAEDVPAEVVLLRKKRERRTGHFKTHDRDKLETIGMVEDGVLDGKGSGGIKGSSSAAAQLEHDMAEYVLEQEQDAEDWQDVHGLAPDELSKITQPQVKDADDVCASEDDSSDAAIGAAAAASIAEAVDAATHVDTAAGVQVTSSVAAADPPSAPRTDCGDALQ